MSFDVEGHMDRNELTRVHYRPYCTYETRLIDHVMSTKLLNDRLRVAEVGARGGSDDQWRALGANIEIVGFEPDADECLRLNAERTRHNDGRGMPLSRYVPTALWRDIGSQEFYVTYDPCCSSVFPPNVEFFKRLPDQSKMAVTSTGSIETTTLDLWSAANNIVFDFIPIDTQGGELAVLEGAAQHLQDAIIGAVVEVEFVELYKGQPLFSDVEAFMRDLGFTLFDLDIRRWRRRDLPTGSIPGRQSGQIVWADGLWLKDPLDKANADATWACDRATKLVVLAELFGLPDYAIELTEHFGERSVFSRDRVAAFVRCLTANQPVSRRLR